jgi:hypothetical protein
MAPGIWKNIGSITVDVSGLPPSAYFEGELGVAGPLQFIDDRHELGTAAASRLIALPGHRQCGEPVGQRMKPAVRVAGSTSSR